MRVGTYIAHPLTRWFTATSADELETALSAQLEDPSRPFDPEPGRLERPFAF